ncbi:MAG: hypothetical protein K1W39_07465 [Lachnospiraceae bacterium]|jgi:hypothetical protein
MNQKTLKKNISNTQATYAPEKAMLYNGGLSYRFEIMDDGNIYSISFDAGLTQEETKKMLESVQNCLYEKTAGYIQKYLEQSNIAYTSFVASRKPLTHSKAMKLTELFLHSENCISLDTHTSNADIYYAIIDHQQSDNKGKCEGCYIVAQKTPVLSKCQHKYSIIGQTFSCNETNSDEYGYFAIRVNKDNGLVNNIALSSGEPVLPSFGCIDLPTLLLNIDNIQTAEQVIEIAVK